MYRVFRVPRGAATQLDLLSKDDLVSRQSIVVREASALGIPGDGSIVLVEGSEAGVARAEALLKEASVMLSGAEAEAAYRSFRSQDENAASGMGLLFG
ncbi:MAG TPA: hypothetical protein VJ300_09225 [Thermoplasmata archaeon]|nr:hypothetical protein [Thermoplasmata archaeon]